MLPWPFLLKRIELLKVAARRAFKFFLKPKIMPAWSDSFNKQDLIPIRVALSDNRQRNERRVSKIRW